MKKFSVAVLTILTIVLGSFLAACNFKKPEISFTESEIVFSLQETKDLNDFLEVKGIDKAQISYRFSNPEMFQATGSKVTAGNVAGRGIVYATYQNNSLASAQLVVKERFAPPAEFSLSESSLVAWGPVSGVFDGVSIFAEKYKIEGQHITNSQSGEEIFTPISKEISGSSYQLENGNGIYKLNFTTVGKDYFDDSERVQKTFYVGYMPQLQKEDFSWEDGLLSWSAVAGAKYVVKFDNEILATCEENSFDLSEKLNSVSADVAHTVSVIVSDISQAEDRRFDTESERMTISKLSTPNVRMISGEMLINPQEDAENFEVNLTSQAGQTINLQKKAGTTSFDEEIAAGVRYVVSVVAVGNKVENGQEDFVYRSEAFIATVCKLATPQLSGLGNNAANGTTFNLSASLNCSIFATLAIFDGTERVKEVALNSSIDKRAVSVDIQEAGFHNMVARLENSGNVVQAGVYYLNSDKSDVLQMTKVDEFETPILHEYDKDTGKSVFTFKKVNFASEYRLLPTNGTRFIEDTKEDYVVDIAEEFVTITLNGKVEDLFESANGDYSFQVLAKTQDELLSINSQTIKILKMLSAPNKVSVMNTVETNFTWAEVENAEKYRLEIYTLTAEEFEENKENESFVPTTIASFSPHNSLEVNHFNFEKEGYYCVRVYAENENQNDYVSSKNFLQQMFFVQKQLYLGEVKFGYGTDLTNQEGLTGASGYFVMIDFTDDVTKYQLSISQNNSSLTETFQKQGAGENMIYLLSDNFESGRSVLNLVGLAEDETIYLTSQPFIMEVERIAPITERDFQPTNPNSRLKIDDFLPNQSVTVVASSSIGVRNIIIEENDKHYVSSSESATLDVAWPIYNNFKLNFKLEGTSAVDSTFNQKNVKIFQTENGKVFLDAVESSYYFERLNSPSGLEYFDGTLKFTHRDIARTKFYVVDFDCTDNNGEKFSISIHFDADVTAHFGDISCKLGMKEEFVAFGGENFNEVEIAINKVIEKLKSDIVLSAMYNQMNAVDFCVYAYQANFENSKFILSSGYATAKLDGSTSVTIKKLKGVSLSFNQSERSLTWTSESFAGDVSSEVQQATLYNVFAVGNNQPLATLNTSSWTIEENLFGNGFFVKVQNPYFLESVQSNIVNIHKLTALSVVGLTEDGCLSFEISAKDKVFCEEVEISIDGEKNRVSLENGRGKLRIETAGVFAFRLIGTEHEQADGTLTYYFDSDVATWTVKEMSEIAPENKELTIENNQIMWESVATSGSVLNALDYTLIFMDENPEHDVVVFKTTNLSVNWQDNSDLRQKLEALNAGNITIGLSAHINAHDVAASGTIYFAKECTLLGGKKEFNHLIYTTDKQIKKLTKPEIVGIEFVGETTADVPYVQTPDIYVKIKGNYGTEAAFQIYREGTDEAVYILDSVLKDVDDTYAFTIAAEDYNGFAQSGEVLKFFVYALNHGQENTDSIPSSAGEIVLTRAADLLGIEIEEESYAQQLKILYKNAQDVSQGIVLKFDFQTGTVYKLLTTNAEVKQNFVKFSQLQELIEENLPNGGNVKISAYINNSIVDNKIILSSKVLESEIFTVLKPVSKIERKDFGFVIESENDEEVMFVVDFAGQTFEVAKNEDGQYVFNVPNDWENELSPYPLSIFATKQNNIFSAKFQYAFTLERIESVGTVSLQRKEDNMTELSWDSVAGAQGYLIYVYKRNGLQKGALLTSLQSDKVKYSLSEIFGEGYENIYENRIGTDKFTYSDLMGEKPCDILIEIITKGGEDKNNSKAKVVIASIQGNSITSSNLTVDEFGNILFADVIDNLGNVDFTQLPEKEYMYRFVSGDGSPIYSQDGQLLSVWKMMDGNMLDTSSLQLENLAFNVEIVVVGSAQASSDGNIILDSKEYSTVTLSSTYYKMPKILDVAMDASRGLVTFTTNSNNFSSIYAALSDKAIMQGKAFALSVTRYGIGSENDEYVFACKLEDLISQLSLQGVTQEEASLYFWMYRESTGSNLYVHSDAYELSYKNLQSVGFKELVKDDFVNTFALFEKDPTSRETVGIFVKIQQQDVIETKFVTLDMLQNSEFEDFAINLTELFEEEQLQSLTGKVEVSFARACIANLSDYAISSWSVPIELSKLEGVSNVQLRDGNLTWNEADKATTKYFVYFYSDVEKEIYTYLETASTTLNVSDHTGEDNVFYLAVQAVDDKNINSIASKKEFKLDSLGNLQAIYKNQINSPLTLKDGKLYIDWTLDGLFSTLTQNTGSYASQAKELVSKVFTSPFTFTLQELVDGNVYFRMRFSSIEDGSTGIGKTFDVRAIDLLSSLIDFGHENNFDVLMHLDTLYRNAESVADQVLISRFRNAISNSSFGVANSNIIFDQYFEALQTGAYRLEYCLVSSLAMNSHWKSYLNVAQENKIYVNEEPIVKAMINSSVTEKAYNELKIVIKKSKIWQFDSVNAEYVQVLADNYVVKLGQQVYSIFKDELEDGAYKYKLMQLNVEESKVIDVYECNEQGQKGTDCLMFYLNYNDGDSLLGAFSIEARGAQEMQIYALGNDCSVSSKSSFFSITFLKFDSFGLSDGTFVWGATYQNRPTTVLIRRYSDRTDTEISIDGSRATSQFSLEGYGKGSYTLKFILEGEVRGNVILVDSDTYYVEHAYKLASPNVYTSAGNIAINVDQSQLKDIYSNNELQRFVIFNDYSGANLTKTFSNADGEDTLLYEVGVTNLSETDPDYVYKRTEEFARRFQIRMLGSTATLSFSQQSEKEYYIKNVLCVDVDGHESAKGVALRSELSAIDASMLSSVQNIRVENGVLKWDEIEEKDIIEDDAQVVYKITIEKYRKSNISNGFVDTTVADKEIFYTAKTTFDMSVLDKETQASDVYIKATVQALALFVSQDFVYVDKVELVEGGYGYGSPTFKQESERFVLMGNCRRALSDIRRLAPVENLDVVDGRITWRYRDASSTIDAFTGLYDFIVTDKQSGEEILGEFEVSIVHVGDGENIFEITFKEYPGQLREGDVEIDVFASQGKRNTNVVIKSFAESLHVTKLKAVSVEDFTITSNTENNTETLSLEKYFKENPHEKVIATVEIDKETMEFKFDAQNAKLYILTSNQTPAFMDGYVGSVVIGRNVVNIKFVAIRENTAEKIVFSDESEKFPLQRTSWGNSSISWTEDRQEFTWDYDLCSFNEQVEAKQVRFAQFLTAQTTLYDEEGEEIETLPSGTEIVLLDTSGTGDIKILHQGVECFIPRSSRYERRVVEILDENDQPQTQLLDSTVLFRVVESGTETSIIQTENGIFEVATNLIISPVFIVQAQYVQRINGQEIVQTRSYTTTENVFRPNLVGRVKITVRIKINNVNLLSEGIESTFESFDLFASGEGTAARPFVIENEVQFKNIAYRMQKDEMLKEYSSANITILEDENFHFQLTKDINLENFNGILFSGVFDGIFDGKNHTITYTSTGVSRLSSAIKIAEEDTALYYTTNDRSLTYNRGSALFEEFAAEANVSNLNLRVTFGAETFVMIESHSLIAGLVVKNDGRIENVNLVAFENHFYGDINPRAAMAYSGIVSINRGGATVSGCSATSNMEFNDNNRSQIISISGIVYTNYGAIENCISGQSGSLISVVCQELRRNGVQVAGIAVTNAQSASIRNCTNNFDIEVSSATSNSATCYLAGIVILGKGSVSGNNFGTLNAFNIEASKGDIFVKRS